MKKRLFKFLLSAAAISFICNCGGEDTISSVNYSAYVVTEPSYVYNDLYITASGLVLDKDGNQIGTADPATGTLYDLSGNITEQGIDFGALNVVYPPVVQSDAWILTAADLTYVIYPDGNVTDAAGTPVGTIVFNTDPETGIQTSVGNIVGFDGTPIFENVDTSTLNVRQANTTPTPAPGPESSASEQPLPESSTGYTHNPAVSSATQPTPGSSAAQPALSSASQQNPQSSAQQQKSSSSQQQPKSSSSQQQATPNFKIKNGGRSGQGWGSRYWDCCKPHCAWKGKGGPIARTCNAQGQTMTKGDDEIKSICDGGQAGVCTDQAPVVINDNLAYAFAAGPGNEYAGSCGACFLLTFNGNSQHTTDARTKALVGKQLVIMISNIGYDVQGNQFDIMIPGGGVGAFDGCSALWGIDQGARQGGYLNECGGADALKSDAEVAKVQKCLEDKCNSKFASIPSAKAGCLFHAQWLMAANNPQFTFQELESCPQELSSRY